MRRIISLLLSSCLLLTSASSAFANVPVIDASNLAQNILTAVRTLQSNINEALMIHNQIKSLQNEFKNLTNLRFSMLEDYTGRYHELFSTVGRVQGLMQDLSGLESKFADLYPEYDKMQPVSSSEIAHQAERWLSESRDMMKGASLTGAQVLESLPQTQQELERLVLDSQRAPGILSATQAGNQISAQIAGNLTSLNTQLASYNQAHMSMMMTMVEGQEANLNRKKQVLLDTYDESTQTVPLRPF